MTRLALGSVMVLSMLLGPLGCSSKMEGKECDKLRGEAFEILNKAQHCNTDADCRQSDWPGCAKPISNGSHEKIAPLNVSFKKGQCEEPKLECKEPPPAYCKQGLCTHKEKGTPEGADNTPSDQIIIQ